jgi:biotin-(acetyl-CoA carboxylase) ligase
MPCQMGKWICGPRVVNSEVTAGVGRIGENFCSPPGECYSLTMIEASGSSETVVDDITSHKSYFFVLYRRENTTTC